MAVGPVTSLLGALFLAGRPGRELAVRLDLVRALGVRPAWRRLRDGAGADGGEDGLSRAYERLWRDAAAAVGAEVLTVGGGFLELRRDGRAVRVWNHWIPLDDAVTLRLALEKSVVHRLLADAGLPVPEHVELDRADLRSGLSFLAARGPCVLKPAGASGGAGTTSGIRRPEQLVRAAMRAGRLAPRLLLERQVEGDVFRLLFLDGELLDVIRRRPATVVGDGRSSVEELIAAENARRAALRDEVVDKPLWIDLDCVFALERAGLTLRSVPAADELVTVKGVTSQNRVEDNETVREGIGEALVDAARRAADVVRLRLAGVDVVTADAARSLDESAGVILEVNGTPGLHYHYEVADHAAATEVAVPVLRRLLREPL